METTNNVQKTENRKSEKPVMKTLAVVISLVLFSFVAGASGLFMYSPASHYAKVDNTSNASLFEASAEKNLEIENWMTNEKYFGSQTSGIEMEVEESLKVEEWMLNYQNFSETTNNTESDSALEVEDWMLDASIWRN